MHIHICVYICEHTHTEFRGNSPQRLVTCGCILYKNPKFSKDKVSYSDTLSRGALEALLLPEENGARAHEGTFVEINYRTEKTQSPPKKVPPS